MIKIAHRGNIAGTSEHENAPAYIDEALTKGYEVEIDVWFHNDSLWLGHGSPTYMTDYDWIQQRADRLWCHAKNFEALDYLLGYHRFNCFWHQEDNYTVTSKGFIWAYPGWEGSNTRTIAVKPNGTLKLDEFYGICTDDFSKLEI